MSRMGDSGEAGPSRTARQGGAAVPIRFASFADLDQLMEMWDESVREIAPMDAVAAQVDLARTSQRRWFFQQLISGEDTGVVVGDAGAGELAGMVSFQEFYNTPFFSVTHLAFISAVHVRRAYRRMGLTRRMTEFTLAWLRRRGVQEVQLENSPRNLVAEETWSRLGFEIITVKRRLVL